MSYINELTLAELSLNSEAYGATSNATISTDDSGDIILSPSTTGGVYANNSLITPAIYLGSSSSSVPTITTDSAGDINLNTVSGTVNIYGGSAPTLASPGSNLYISSGDSNSLNLNGYDVNVTSYNTGSSGIALNGNTTVGTSTTSASLTVTGTTTLSGNTTVTGSTTLGTNSTAISNIQFGIITFSDISEASGSNTSGSLINLNFSPTSLVFGIGSPNSNSPLYPVNVQWVTTTPTTGYTWSALTYLVLPQGNDSSSISYYFNWIAIA
jgi:hypothetical protein